MCLRDTSRNTAGQSWSRREDHPGLPSVALLEQEVLHAGGRESSGAEAGPLQIPVLGGNANITFGTAGHVFRNKVLEEQFFLFKVNYLLIFPQHRTCLEELCFVKRDFLEGVCLIFFPQGPAFNALSVIAAHQLDSLLIILHLLCFSQGN